MQNEPFSHVNLKWELIIFTSIWLFSHVKKDNVTCETDMLTSDWLFHLWMNVKFKCEYHTFICDKNFHTWNQCLAHEISWNLLVHTWIPHFLMKLAFLTCENKTMSHESFTHDLLFSHINKHFHPLTLFYKWIAHIYRIVCICKRGRHGKSYFMISCTSSVFSQTAFLPAHMVWGQNFVFIEPNGGLWVVKPRLVSCSLWYLHMYSTTITQTPEQPGESSPSDCCHQHGTIIDFSLVGLEHQPYRDTLITLY